MALLGAVLVTATARWSMAELKDLLVALAPVLGIITGAFVTFFFTRQAAATAVSAAQTATGVVARNAEADRAEAHLKARIDEVQTLRGALTTAYHMTDAPTQRKMRQNQAISAALSPQ